MKIALASQPKDALTVSFVKEGDLQNLPIAEQELTQEFTGKKLTTYYSREHKLLLVGLGKEPDADMLRRAAGIAAKSARQYSKQANFTLPEDSESVAKAITEGLILGNYRFLKYKTQNLDEQKQLDDVIIVGSEELKMAIEDAKALAQAVCYARDLVNTPPIDLNPTTLEHEAKQLAKKHALKYHVYDEAELKKRKMNAIVAVGQGSEHKARMIILEYKHAKATKHYAFCGKGVCYDSGGYNLKMRMQEDMKDDMGGAAALLGMLDYLAATKKVAHATVIIGAVENLIANNAYKPGDVVRASNGKTIEVANTDAEGRIVLSDCLSYASTLKPDCLIDIATLTGASMIALGTLAGAICTPNDDIATALITSGESSGDRAWRIPMWDDYKEDIKSDIADVKNMGYQMYAGITAGAVFLQEFVEEPQKWAHIDMGGAVNEPRERPYKPKGATGWGVRLLCEFIMTH